MGFWNNTNPKYGEPFVDKVDKNGTKHWVDHNCPKCGGTGYLPGYEHVDGARCWKCGATGRHTHTWKEYTPEYAAILAAKREAKAIKKNLAERPDFLEKNGFDENGKTYVVIGNTFEIKDELKAAGARFSNFGWLFNYKPENFPHVELTIDDCFTENCIKALWWKDAFDIKQIIKERTPNEPSKSEYIGEVGKRLTLTLTVKVSFSFETNFTYYGGTSYIHNMIDENGNTVIWKTATHLKEGETYQVTGTVKEHSEYKGTKQTVLTRCKVA